MNECTIGHLLPGSLLCGWLRAPSVLMCGDQDWDVTGQGSANRICGAGLTYNKQQRSFVFDFGGQKFIISERHMLYVTEERPLLHVDGFLFFHAADSALPADSKANKNYQAAIVSFQAIFLDTGT